MCKDITKYIYAYFYIALLLSLHRPLEYAMISFLLLPAQVARKTAHLYTKAFWHPFNNLNIVPFLFFCFVVSILIGTFYQIVFKMPNTVELLWFEL